MVKVANPALTTFRSARLAPAYDIMNTKFFSQHVKPMETIEPMMMPINHQSKDVQLPDLLAYAALMDIDANTASQVAFETADGIAKVARELFNDLPAIIVAQPLVLHNVQIALQRAAARAHLMFPEIDPEMHAGMSRSTSAPRRAAP
jgi:uncharacterized protein YjgD (DUF1641 family)